MNEEELIKLTKQNIWTALEDYFRHADDEDGVYDNISDSFVDRLARDSVKAKSGLRELFRKSPVWDEQLQALVINGTRTHEPDLSLVFRLGRQILSVPMHTGSEEMYVKIERAIQFFSTNDEETRELGLEAIKELAPKAYAPGKKLSRVFKALCQALGVADETAGSDFQRLYAQFADELSAKKISFKLFVSINPAHFLTMSNPKYDERGSTLTSCHSFNSTEYEWNNGCTGYARDEVTFIVFTASDPSDPETLNNRKTTRQIFAYKPDNGVLLQSRLYNTSGGTEGAQAESEVYRDLIQREISALEEQPNLWTTSSATSKYYCVCKGEGFGGYEDWTYEHFNPKISIRRDHTDCNEPLVVGTHGLCISCSDLTSKGLYCYSCSDEDYSECEECGRRFPDEDLTRVRNERGDDVYVCERCLDRHYSYCDRCEEYYPNDEITEVDGSYYCYDCRDEIASECHECEEWYRDKDMRQVIDDHGHEVYVCDECLHKYYTRCESCEEYVHDDLIETAYNEDEKEIEVCRNCLDNHFEKCECCEEWYAPAIMRDGLCRSCWSSEEELKAEEERKAVAI